ncbi:MAG: hypothetical protein HDT23_06965 [Ruminococcus sp.]|nr:hypothetical protein [Ruminococcus sp.]
MKNKQFISAVMAVAMVATSFNAFSAFAVDDPDETGNTMFDADPIAFNKKVDGEFSETYSYGSCDNDWYSFSLDTASKLTIELSSTLVYVIGTVCPSYEIIDADNDNNVVYTFDRFKSQNTNIIALPAGNYYIHLASNKRSDTGTYSLRLVNNATTGDSFDALSNNSIGKASTVKFDTEYTGHFYENDTVDYYTFDLAEEGMVTINFDSSFDDVDWKIYNSDKEAVEEGTFSKADNNEKDSDISLKKSYVMTAGTFTIGIMKNAKSEMAYGDYTLKLDYLKDYNNYHASGVFACTDLNHDGMIDAIDSGAILAYYAYLSTGGNEKKVDLNVWCKTYFPTEEK